MPSHRLLERQMRRRGLAVGEAPSAEQWQAFLVDVASTYKQADEDRYLLERSLEISSKELHDRVVKDRESGVKLAQANKLAGLGTLASGVAHELNNPLAAVKGFLEMIEEESTAKADTIVAPLAVRCLRQVDRMAKIINHMRRLARETTPDDVVPINIGKPIHDSIDMLRTKLKLDGIHVHVEELGETRLVRGDEIRLESIFQNLLVNAFDAFGQSAVDRERKAIAIRIDYRAPETVLIVVNDNAGGISETSLERIFDPFYTTKSIGKGTGLGLSICRQVVEEHKGTITADNANGGLRFVISIPTVAEKGVATSISDCATAAVSVASHYGLGVKRILVVDDEEGIREVLEHSLKSHFEIISVASPEEAIEALGRESFDVLMTDVSMPGSSGIELAKHARQLAPSLRIVIMSGNLASDTQPGHGGIEGAVFWGKPFDKAEVLRHRLTQLLVAEREAA